MFYNDPMLYGATLPYKDVNFQTPFMPQYYTPWQNLQRMLPQGFPNFGFQDFQKIPYGQLPQLPFMGLQNFPLQQFPFQQFPFQQPPFQGLLPTQGYTPYPQYGYGFQTPFYGYRTPFPV